MPPVLPPSAAHPAPPTMAAGLAWSWSGRASLDAVRSAGLAARQFLAGAGAPDEDLAAWELLFAEAGNNVALHGGEADPDQLLDIDLRFLPGRIVARFTDQTTGFDWPESISLPDSNAESGRGLFIIQALTSTRHYQRGITCNTLTLERPCLPPPPSPSLSRKETEAILDAMTAELSACYESLSAIFRFTAEARQSSTLEDFAHRLLKHLITITAADYAVLRISAGTGLQTLAALGCGAPPTCALSASPMPLETAAIRIRQDQWIEPDSSRPAGSPQAGLVHPFYDGDELMGVLSIGRCHSQTPLNAGEVNIIHTFAEFFAQQVLSRNHADAAIKASIAQRELELAAGIQRSLLPGKLPFVPGLTLAGHCESALTVGGDFYDVIPWNNLGFFFIVADVMGKGVGASMIAAVTRSVFRSLTQLHQTPGKAMERAARLLYDDLERLELFVTAAIGVVDLYQGVVRIANAGHCPVLISTADGSIISAEPSMPPLGLEKSPSCTELTIPFLPGSRLLAYSDGLIDPRDQRSPFPSPEEASIWFSLHAPCQPDAASLKAVLLSQIGSLPAQGSPAALADDQTFLIITRDRSLTPS